MVPTHLAEFPCQQINSRGDHNTRGRISIPDSPYASQSSHRLPLPGVERGREGGGLGGTLCNTSCQSLAPEQPKDLLIMSWYSVQRLFINCKQASKWQGTHTVEDVGGLAGDTKKSLGPHKALLSDEG